MDCIEGNIVDVLNRKITKGVIHYDDRIRKIEYRNDIVSSNFILPGFVDAHVHIESSMCTPYEYSKMALKFGTVASICDPHEIANVLGVGGVEYMISNADHSPMKIYFGAPSCVPATPFETSGASISSEDIELLFQSDKCLHLSEMMNYPGVISGFPDVMKKIELAHKYNRLIDGHAPLLSGNDLKKYVSCGISSDHECVSIDEAIEKIELGMKIMLRKSSVSNDFSNLLELISIYPKDVMFCTDDCHPDDLQHGYINDLVVEAIDSGYDIFDVLQAASLNCVEHFQVDVGLLQENDAADFLVVEDLKNFKILSTYVNGKQVYTNKTLFFEDIKNEPINNYFLNEISIKDIRIEASTSSTPVIGVINNSLMTNKLLFPLPSRNGFSVPDIDNDILKIVVLNRYHKAKPSVAFVKGLGLYRGAIASTVAHDSHNIVAIGATDEDIIEAINIIHHYKGGLVVFDSTQSTVLPLPIAGLMSTKSCDEVTVDYLKLTQQVKNLGSNLRTPFMTLAFMSLLVIPELKISDKGLFDVNKFDFINSRSV